MDRELISRLKDLTDSDETVFSIGHNTFFTHDGGTTILRCVTDKGTTEHALSTIAELCEGSAAFESADDRWIDTHLPLLMAIESGIDRAREEEPDLKDEDVVAILQRLIFKPEINLDSPLALAIQDRLKLTLACPDAPREAGQVCRAPVLFAGPERHPQCRRGHRPARRRVPPELTGQQLHPWRFHHAAGIALVTDGGTRTTCGDGQRS